MRNIEKFKVDILKFQISVRYSICRVSKVLLNMMTLLYLGSIGERQIPEFSVEHYSIVQQQETEMNHDVNGKKKGI